MIDEPVELRDHMRAFAAVAPRRARAELAAEVATVVAEACPGAAAGLGETIDVERVCAGYQRELWLWLVGERTWDQCLSGLLGRLQRRASVEATGVTSP